jgi:hypothetical protein
MARDKHKHMKPGDVLVDDRENHRAAYEAAGVVFVHHKNRRGQRPQACGAVPTVERARRSGRLRRLAAAFRSTFSTHSGPEHPARGFDQPGAVAGAFADRLEQDPAAVGCRCGSAAAAQNAAGSHGRAAAPISRS